MKRTIVVILSILMICVAFACSNKSASVANNSYYSDDGYYYGGDTVAEMEAPIPAAAYDEMKAESAFTSDSVRTNNSSLLSNRKIIRNADLSVQTLEFDAFLEKLGEQVAKFGGYVESSSIGGRTYYNQSRLRNAYLSIRIPADRLDDFISTVDGLGNVVSRSTGMVDVTTNYIDTAKHLEALRTEQEALLGILKEATTVEDIITVQSRLSEVRYQIESYESIIRSYDDQIDLSTVSIDVNEVERETIVEPETFGQEVSRRFKESMEDVGEFFRNLGAWILGNAPQIVVFLAFNGVIVLIIVLSIKGGIRRRAKRRAKAAQKQA